MFENQKIVIWGSGKEGLSIQTYLAKQGIHAATVDGDEIDLSDVDIIFKSPGVSLYNPCIQKALSKGIKVLSGTNLFMMMLSDATKTIAITGTKGKSTTSSLLAHILKSKGLSVGYGGNIGVPLVEMIGQKYDYFVAELSSYQCADLVFPFDVSVVVNLYPEHIDWHTSHDRYYEDKLNLLRIRKTGKIGVLNWENTETLLRTKGYRDIVYFNNPCGFHVADGWIKEGDKCLFSSDKITNLKGVHNLENICAVLTVLRHLKIDLTDIEKDIASFEPLPHRLQTVACVNGVTFVDDSISTTPQTAVAALKAFDSARHIYLLVGGYDRQQDYAPLLDYVNTRADEITLVTLPVTGTRIAAQAADLDVIEAANVSDAVKKAQEKARKGDVILLSPAAPSYHAYKNFEARGADFSSSILKT